MRGLFWIVVWTVLLLPGAAIGQEVVTHAMDSTVAEGTVEIRLEGPPSTLFRVSLDGVEVGSVRAGDDRRAKMAVWVGAQDARRVIEVRGMGFASYVLLEPEGERLVPTRTKRVSTRYGLAREVGIPAAISGGTGILAVIVGVIAAAPFVPRSDDESALSDEEERARLMIEGGLVLGLHSAFNVGAAVLLGYDTVLPALAPIGPLVVLTSMLVSDYEGSLSNLIGFNLLGSVILSVPAFYFSKQDGFAVGVVPTDGGVVVGWGGSF